MSTIDTVVFDIGNVLIRWDPCNLYRRMGYADAATAAILAETRLLEINHRVLDAGGPIRTTLDALASRFPQHAAFLDAFDTRWAEMLGSPIEASFATKARLRRSGVPVHAISNFHRQNFDVAQALFPALGEFDELILSGDVGLVKPDADIFELLVQRRKLDPARTVFIDDSAQNIATARQLGFATIHFTDGRTDLEGELLRLGLPSGALNETS